MYAVVIALAAVTLLGAGVVFAGIKDSKHDLTSGSAAAIKAEATYTEICAFCHTPHNARTGSAPLWNRAAGTENVTYTAYVTARGTSSVPGGASKACLSCHDGSLGANSLVNAGFDGQPVFSAATEALMNASPAAIGINPGDLSNDHPVGVSLPTATDYQTAAAVISAGLALFGTSQTVECATCHDAHEYGTAVAGTMPFLAKSNLASGMCTTCHLK